MNSAQDPTVAKSPDTIRFGVFEFDRGRLTLSREGRPLRLQPQPAQVLAALLANAGRLVTRDELRQAVWRDDTFVDFDRGLNFCVAQIRTALGDDASTPRFIQTVPKRGYKFIAPSESLNAGVAAPGAPDSRPRPARHPWRVAVWAVPMVFVLGAAALIGLSHYAPSPIVAVARFDNETGDAALTRFSDALTDSVVERLASASAGGYGVIGNAAVLRGPREMRDLLAIGSSLHAQYVILGQVQRDDQRRLRVLAHLIRLPDQTHVAVGRIDPVADTSLSEIDELADAIARRFDARLRNPKAPAASSAPAGH